MQRLPRLLLLSICAAAPLTAISAETSLGESKQDSIEVCMPKGQRAYLSQLVCANGEAPNYQRLGSFGNRNPLPENLTSEQHGNLLEQMMRRGALQPGEIDYHVIDKFELTCGDVKRVVYVDMYHCEQAAPAVAPRGFTLRPVKAPVGA